MSSSLLLRHVHSSLNRSRAPGHQPRPATLLGLVQRSRFHGQCGPHRVPRGSGPRSPSFGYHRSSPVLLDKFVKHVKYEASLVVKAPFHIKVKGSHFDHDPAQLKTASSDVSETDPRTELPSILKKLMHQRQIGDKERDILNQLTEDIRVEYESQLNEFRRMDPHFSKKTQLHFLLNGRKVHRVDSYSILSSKSQHSHVYVTDATNFEEAQAMIARLESGNKFESCGSISIWQPKYPGGSSGSDMEPGSGISSNAEVVGGLKLYIPHHVLETFDNGLKGVFLVPTLMDRIYLQSKNEGSVELDGQLINELVSVGIYTEAGHIRVKELCSCEVKLASRFGDIVSEGTLEGHVVVETYGQGAFRAKYIEGPTLTVTTESGDVLVSGDCNSNSSQFFTQTGNITLKHLYNSNCILIREKGELSLNLVQGEITGIVKKGNIHATLESITGSSSLQAMDGDITLTIPEKHSFRICATAITSNIAPKILNTGELFLSEKSAHQKFTSGSLLSGKDEDYPLLTISVPNDMSQDEVFAKMSWTRIPCCKSELRLDIVLKCGQSFRWKNSSENSDHWIGVLKGRVWLLSQDDSHLMYKTFPKAESPSDLDGAIQDYFQLKVDLAPLYEMWAEHDPVFKEIATSFSGVRMLRQDPVENLFAFICSSNNNIQRISSMVENLCLHYGTRVLDHEELAFHSFPTVAQLARNSGQVEKKLRSLGFGYRAGYIAKSAKQIADKGGEEYLMSLRSLPYAKAREELLQLAGIGPKVADCVLLMSLDQPSAIPVDTHMFQIAATKYLPHLKGYKSVTDKVYKEIADHFRSLYGDYAGWAHS
eukprot:maker-scaffold722_size106786-snap-gene-0.33 protein:Tk04297 transcript:maker-scaffold722_size106786-snap-gene-0.33-mRNA-1 annotation:"8-oxoguanine dna glycosylase"